MTRNFSDISIQTRGGAIGAIFIFKLRISCISRGGFGFPWECMAKEILTR